MASALKLFSLWMGIKQRHFLQVFIIVSRESHLHENAVPETLNR